MLNKADLLAPEEADRRVKAIIKALKWKGPHFIISAINGEGTAKLTFAIMEHVDAFKQQAIAAAAEAAEVRAEPAQTLENRLRRKPKV